MPKLSIITINLNNANGLEKTIQSVISQIYQSFEYIVIDGNSEDNSVNVIRQYSNKISYWVSESDSGIYNAMNKGIRKAKGEYLLFLNSGDYFYSEKVLNQFLEKEFDEDFVYGNILLMFSDRTYLFNEPGKSNISFIDLYSGTLNHPGVFIKKTIFDRYGYYNESYKIVADWVLYLKAIIMGCATVRYKDITMVCFDMYGVSNQKEEYVQEEKELALNQIIPQRILADYKRMTKREFLAINRIRKNKLLYFVFFLMYRFLRKFEAKRVINIEIL